VPVNGAVHVLPRMQGRHHLRPAHIHFLIAKPGFRTQFVQACSSDDAHLETDVQFAVTAPLVGRPGSVDSSYAAGCSQRWPHRELTAVDPRRSFRRQRHPLPDGRFQRDR